MTISEALIIGETIEEQMKHGYKPSSREIALVTLAKQVRRLTAERN
jgi:hypothetical protein